jgi:hypothetical protein
MPPDGEGRLPVTSQAGGPDANNVTITTASLTDQPAAPLVSVPAAALAAAADLLLSQAEREAAAYDEGRLAGFGDGWHQGLTAGLERSAR